MTELPAIVAHLLDASIARVRRIYCLRGLAATLAALLAAALLVMAVDAKFTLFSDFARFALTAALYASVVLTAWFALVRPLRRPLDRLRVAKILDDRHPEHEECLTTLVEIVADARSRGRLGCSQALFDILSRKAETAAHALVTEREFTARTIRRRLGWLMGAAAVLALSFVLVPHVAGRLFLRAVAPWVDVGNLYANDITVTPGDLVVLAGETVRIAATVAEGVPGTPQIRISRRAAVGWGPEFATDMTDNAYETVADLVESEWRYRVSVGPAVSQYYTVRVCALPAAESFVARIDYPAYAGRSPSVLSNEEVGTVTALAGSRVTFALTPKPGVHGSFRIGDESVFEHVMVSNRTVAWSLALTDEDGFRAPLRTGELRSQPDLAPTVLIEEPAAKTLTLPPHAKLPLQVSASDDVGLMAQEIRYRTDAGPWRVWRPLAACTQAGPTLWKGTDELDLSALDLFGARQVSFDLVVSDGCPVELGGPHAATSMPVVVRLAYEAKDFAQQSLADTAEAAKKLLGEAQRRMQAAEDPARRARDQLRWEKRLDEKVERNVEKATQEAEAARRHLAEAERKLSEDARFQPLAEAVRAVRENRLEKALDELEKASFAAQEEREVALDKALVDLQRAQEALKALDRPMQERQQQLENLARTQDLQARQEALAKAAEELAADPAADPRKMAEWKRMEEELQRQVGDLRNRAPDAALDEARREMAHAAEMMDQLQRERENAADLAKSEEERARRAEELAREETARQEANLTQADESARHAEEAVRKAMSEPDRSEARMGEAEWHEQEAQSRLERAMASEALQDLAEKASEEIRKAHDSDRPKEAARAAASKLRRALDAARKDMEEARTDRELARAQAANEARAEEDRRKGEDVNPWTQSELKRLAAEAEKNAARRAEEASRAEAAAETARQETAAALEKDTAEGDREAVAAAERGAEALAKAPVPQAERDAMEAALAAAQERVRARERAELAAELSVDAPQAEDLTKALEENVAAALARAEERAAEVDAALDREDFAAAREAGAQAEEAAAQAVESLARMRRDPELPSAAVRALGRALEAERNAQKQQAEEARHAAQAAEQPNNGQERWAAKWNQHLADESQQQAREAFAAARHALAEARAQAAEAERQKSDVPDQSEAEQPSSDAQNQPSSEQSQAGKPRPTPGQKASEAAGSLAKGAARQARALGVAVARPSQPQRLPQPPADWFRIQGAAKEGLGAPDLRSVPAEYRELVRDYFLKLAEEAK